MPVSKNALIRYKTIDNCLRNHYRKWTLEDLIDACSDALSEYEQGRGYVIECTVAQSELVRPMVNGGTHITEFLLN